MRLVSMIDMAEARQIALTEINRMYAHPDDSLVIVDEETMERPYGWVFFYDSKRHRETGDIADMLGGNAPIIVHRADGQFAYLGTWGPVQEMLSRYESGLQNRARPA